MKKFGLILLGATLFFITLFGDGFSIYLDPPSLVFVLGIMISLLLATDYFGHFIRSFKVLSGYEFTKQERQFSISALALAIKSLIFSGVIGFVFGIVTMLSTLDDPMHIGPALATAMLTLFYAVILSLFLLIIKYQLINIENSNVIEEE